MQKVPSDPRAKFYPVCWGSVRRSSRKKLLPRAAGWRLEDLEAERNRFINGLFEKCAWQRHFFQAGLEQGSFLYRSHRALARMLAFPMLQALA